MSNVLFGPEPPEVDTAIQTPEDMATLIMEKQLRYQAECPQLKPKFTSLGARSGEIVKAYQSGGMPLDQAMRELDSVLSEVESIRANCGDKTAPSARTFLIPALLGVGILAVLGMRS